jgi:hypothetical protein
MDTILQIVGGLAVGAIMAGVAFLYRFNQRIKSTENRTVRMGEVRFPKWEPRTDVFRHEDGTREIFVPVTFDLPFTKHPKVVVGLKEFDLGDKRSNIHRISVRAENVRLNGFDLYFKTWEESLIFDAAAIWIAVGE